MCIVEFLST